MEMVIKQIVLIMEKLQNQNQNQNQSQNQSPAENLASAIQIERIATAKTPMENVHAGKHSMNKIQEGFLRFLKEGSSLRLYNFTSSRREDK